MEDAAGELIKDHKGRLVKAAVGEWDLEVLLLRHCHLHPDDVDRLDPAFVEQLIADIQADSDPAYLKWLEKRRNK